MKELRRIVEDIQSVFEESSYPREFLEVWDQMECLASHNGRETFLVRRKDSGETAVAKCYDRKMIPLQMHPELLRDIRHPGLPHFYEEYRNDQMVCVVREYFEGEPLSEYVRERQMTIPQIAGFGEQLCGILSVLHQHTPPVIHRDIKPENIIVRPDETLGLIDFDISRAHRDNAGNDTIMFGTRGYAPPEQYGFGQTDSRTDIYALGVLLRWMATGSERANRNVAIDARLQRVIDRCTAFAPEERYADVQQVERELRKVWKARRPLPVRRIVTGAALALAALVCGFAVGRWTDWLRPGFQAVFTEPLIEQAVRLQLGKERGALTEEDLMSVRRIYIYGSDAYAEPDDYFRQRVDDHDDGPLRTLNDLQMLPGLEEVHIVQQDYMDVNGLAGLPHLMTVEIKHTLISGIEPIAHVPRLKHAVLFDCGLGDVSALENCPRLETLDVGLNDLRDLKQIGSYAGVRSLGIMWLEMESLDGIGERMPELQAISLQHGTFGDLSGLRELAELETVYVLAEQADAAAAALAGTGAEIHVTEN